MPILPLFKKRMYKELIYIPNSYDYTLSINSDNIILNIDNLEIHFNEKYPFHPPFVYLKKKNSHLINIINICNTLQYKNPNYKLCSKSILLPNNWTSKYKIIDIFNDFKIIKNNIITIFNIFWINSYLKRKYINLHFSSDQGPDIIQYLIDVN